MTNGRTHERCPWCGNCLVCQKEHKPDCCHGKR